MFEGKRIQVSTVFLMLFPRLCRGKKKIRSTGLESAIPFQYRYKQNFPKSIITIRVSFIQGDLTISVNVLFNYLEACSQVPWENLRYLFGEIMYGGHITDDWDRKLCRAYLEEFLHPDQVWK